MDSVKTNDGSRTDRELAAKALLAEYTSLRQESISTITNRIRIITLSFVAHSLIIGGIFSAKAVPELLKILFLSVVLPQLSKASLMMWFGEYRRMLRAADRLIEIEGEVNELFPQAGMKWETKLPSGRPISLPYYAAILMVSTPSLIAYVLAAYILFKVKVFSDSHLGMVVFGLIVFLACIWELVFYAYFISEWWKIRKNRREHLRKCC
jgi:hypothetical protein